MFFRKATKIKELEQRLKFCKSDIKSFNKAFQDNIRLRNRIDVLNLRLKECDVERVYLTEKIEKLMDELNRILWDNRLNLKQRKELSDKSRKTYIRYSKDLASLLIKVNSQQKKIEATLRIGV